MNINVAKSRMISLLKKYNLCQIGWRVIFTNNINFVATCWTDDKIIDMSVPMIKANDWIFIKKVFLHELCHIFYPPYWHFNVKTGKGKELVHHSEWKKGCRELGGHDKSLLIPRRDGFNDF